MFLLRKPLSACALSVVLSTLNILLPVPAIGQEPPLFQPLVALNRRQRDLNDPDLYVADYYPQGPSPLELPRYHYQYQFDDRNFRPAEDEYARGDSGFQSYPVEYPGPRVLEKTLSDFLEENIPSKDDSNEEINKRVLSSFRERMEREKSKEQQQEMFLQKLQEEADNRNIDRDYDNRDYIEMIEELWNKYRNTHPSKESPIFVEEMRKRQVPIDYNSLGWSAVGYKKRSPPSPADNDVFFLKYPQKDVFEDDSRIHYNMLKPLQSDYSYRSYNPEYLYAKRKRFPVTKRSSNFYEKCVHHKRGVNANKKMKKDSASGTDPKVVKDLSNIFGAKDSKKKQNVTGGAKPKKATDKNSKYNKKSTSTAVTTLPEIKTTVKTETIPHDHNHKSEHDHSNMMQHNTQPESVNHTPNDEPLNIKKKSIDWSNYFGIDRRRKKSESFANDNDIDNDWLVKRYNNAVAMAVKRSSEYPLNFFRNHDAKRDSHKQETTNEKETNEETTTKSSADTKLGDMDDKLKNIEDLIIDEALKYTGAHEGETDPKEIQEIKDKVISRLAAAYSLEKMRRALSEFKSSLAAQKYAGKNGEIENAEEAEEAMKKKSPEPEKCKGNCEEDFSSRSGNEIDADKFSDSLVSGSGNCNAIETRCRRLVKNGFGAAFYPICKWHQLCYLCGTDTGSPEELTACDVMFLNRADAICQADVVCQWAARPAVNFLRNIHETAPRELATKCESNTCDVTERTFNIKRR